MKNISEIELQINNIKILYQGMNLYDGDEINDFTSYVEQKLKIFSNQNSRRVIVNENEITIIGDPEKKIHI